MTPVHLSVVALLALAEAAVSSWGSIKEASAREPRLAPLRLRNVRRLISVRKECKGFIVHPVLTSSRKTKDRSVRKPPNIDHQPHDARTARSECPPSDQKRRGSGR